MRFVALLLRGVDHERAAQTQAARQVSAVSNAQKIFF